MHPHSLPTQVDVESILASATSASTKQSLTADEAAALSKARRKEADEGATTWLLSCSELSRQLADEAVVSVLLKKYARVAQLLGDVEEPGDSSISESLSTSYQALRKELREKQRTERLLARAMVDCHRAVLLHPALTHEGGADIPTYNVTSAIFPAIHSTATAVVHLHGAIHSILESSNPSSPLPAIMIQIKTVLEDQRLPELCRMYMERDHGTGDHDFGQFAASRESDEKEANHFRQERFVHFEDSPENKLNGLIDRGNARIMVLDVFDRLLEEASDREEPFQPQNPAHNTALEQEVGHTDDFTDIPNLSEVTRPSIDKPYQSSWVNTLVGLITREFASEQDLRSLLEEDRRDRFRLGPELRELVEQETRGLIPIQRGHWGY